MNQITTRSSFSVEPAPAMQWTTHAMNEAYGRLEDNGRALVGGLAPKARAALVSRRQELAAAFRPASQDDLEREIASLMASFHSARSVSATEARVTVRKYATDLEGLPLWAVRKACNAITRGMVEGLSRDFPPAAPRLVDIVEGVMKHHRKEADQLRMILDAREESTVSPAERARVGEKVIALAASMKMQQYPEKYREPATPTHETMGVSREAWDAIPNAQGRGS